MGIELQGKYLVEIHDALNRISKKLGAIFYYNSKEIFDPKKHLPIPKIEINRSTKYFENHDLDSIRWLAFRDENRDSLLKVLKLKETKCVFLKDGVDSNEILITPHYAGWTFIMGDDIHNILIKGDESSTEEALTNLCKSLQKLSKKFIEVQYFEHQRKSKITGYFKSNNGKLNFGYWESETDRFEKGRIPKEIKRIHPSSAHELASLWSIDPLDFVYVRKMAEQNSILVMPA